jgi:hypothetical protein
LAKLGPALVELAVRDQGTRRRRCGDIVDDE